MALGGGLAAREDEGIETLQILSRANLHALHGPLPGESLKLRREAALDGHHADLGQARRHRRSRDGHDNRGAGRARRTRRHQGREGGDEEVQHGDTELW